MTVEGSTRDRGAVLVETAITIPVFFLMIAIVMELGVMFRDYTALRGTSLEAVRAAVIAGDDFDADHRVLAVIEDVASPLPEDAVQQIVIFKADGSDGEVPASCLVASQNNASGMCNRYTPANMTEALDNFGCDDASDLDNSWCPSDRVVIQAPGNGGPPDYVGVYLEIERQTITGLIGRRQTLRMTNVLRIEPRDR